MVDRRLAPLTALTTLRRPRSEVVRRPTAVPAENDRAPERPSRIVDNAVYAAGRRVATPDSAAGSHEWLTEGFDDRVV